MIQLGPKFRDPYELLGQIYEDDSRRLRQEGKHKEADDKLKESIKSFFFAAYLHPVDPREWVRIAQQYQSVHDFYSAGYCYGRALKSDNHNT